MRRIATTPLPLVVLEPSDSETLGAYYRENLVDGCDAISNHSLNDYH